MRRIIKLQLNVLPSNVTAEAATSVDNCDVSYVAVYNGEYSQRDSTANQIGRYCVAVKFIATLFNLGPISGPVSYTKPVIVEQSSALHCNRLVFSGQTAFRLGQSVSHQTQPKAHSAS